MFRCFARDYVAESAEITRWPRSRGCAQRSKIATGLQLTSIHYCKLYMAAVCLLLLFRSTARLKNLLSATNYSILIVALLWKHHTKPLKWRFTVLCKHVRVTRRPCTPTQSIASPVRVSDILIVVPFCHLHPLNPLILSYIGDLRDESSRMTPNKVQVISCLLITGVLRWQEEWKQVPTCRSYGEDSILVSSLRGCQTNGRLTCLSNLCFSAYGDACRWRE